MSDLRIAVVIASVGRPDSIVDLLATLRTQSRPADRIILSVGSEADLPAKDQLAGDEEIVMGEKGLPRQRNRGMELILEDCDYLVFLDDDYYATKDALKGIEAFFENNPDVAGMEGTLLADGINGPGLSREDALGFIQKHDANPPPPVKIIEDKAGLYGCNMAYRVSAIGEVRFDERLPLYAWQEDVDFANQLLPKGRLVRTTAFFGVHAGVKRGRTNGVKLGYSQIANPIYLLRKGTMGRKAAYNLMGRNILANIAKTFFAEPWVDRWGRVKGNWLAIRHMLTGKVKPEHILKL